MIKLPINVDRYLKPLVVVLIVLWCGPCFTPYAVLLQLLSNA